MERATVIITYDKGETITDQVLVALLDAAPVGQVCLMRGKPNALNEGRSEVSYVYNPKDPRQVRAKQEAEANAKRTDPFEVQKQREAEREKQQMEAPE